MILIIAEKPSLARNIVAGIGEMKKYSSYFEGCGYIVSWAYGHLFSLCDIEDYQENKNPKWRLDNIPCFPKQFKFKLKNTDEGIKKQFVTNEFPQNGFLFTDAVSPEMQNKINNM